MRVLMAAVTALLLSARTEAQTLDRSGYTGRQLYEAACAACHGADGRGQPLDIRGFDTDPPDFTDCSLTTPEADLDWYSVIHQGGAARGFDVMMPAFGEELSDDEIAGVIGYVRGFCVEKGWPHGDLNLPRPFVTEKAYPENEAVVTMTLGRGGARRFSSEFLYEHRVGRRGQYEVFARDVDEIGGAYKHVLFDSLRRGSILSAGGEFTIEEGGAVFEAFAAMSQALPVVTDSFLHLHAGIEAPTENGAPNEAFWRLAVGKTYVQNVWGRAWSPMVEVLAARQLTTSVATELDVLPQLQVSLSTRQHVLLNAGVRVPVTERRARRTSVLVYVLWDWFDGGFFTGW